MTLLEAFRSIGPLLESAPTEEKGNTAKENERRREAAETLFESLQVQSQYLGRMARDRAALEDAMQVVLARLIRVGPRGRREGDPEDDRGVERWLKRSLERALIDIGRRGGRFVQVDPDPPDRDPPGPGRPDSSAEVTEAQGKLWAVVNDKLRPALPPADRETLDELVSIARGDTSFEGVVAEEQRTNGGSRKQARQRLYTRYHRARQVAVETIRALKAAGTLSEEEVRWMMLFLEVLKLGGIGGKTPGDGGVP